MKHTLDPNSNRKSISKVLSKSGARLSYIMGGLGGTSLLLCVNRRVFSISNDSRCSILHQLHPLYTHHHFIYPPPILMHTLTYMFIHTHSHVHTLACYTHIHSNTHTNHHNPHMFINIHSTHMLKHIPTCS